MVYIAQVLHDRYAHIPLFACNVLLLRNLYIYFSISPLPLKNITVHQMAYLLQSASRPQMLLHERGIPY